MDYGTPGIFEKERRKRGRGTDRSGAVLLLQGRRNEPAEAPRKKRGKEARKRDGRSGDGSERRKMIEDREAPNQSDQAEGADLHAHPPSRGLLLLATPSLFLLCPPSAGSAGSPAAGKALLPPPVAIKGMPCSSEISLCWFW